MSDQSFGAVDLTFDNGDGVAVSVTGACAEVRAVTPTALLSTCDRALWRDGPPTHTDTPGADAHGAARGDRAGRGVGRERHRGRGAYLSKNMLIRLT